MSLSLLKSSFFMLFRVWRNMFSVRGMCFLLQPFKKYSPNIGRFFCVSVTFSLDDGFSAVFFVCAAARPSCFPNVCMLLPVCLHVCTHACVRTTARNTLCRAVSVRFWKHQKTFTCNRLVYSGLQKNLQIFLKKVLRKSCRNGKSAYLCNRFREGEPLKMTEW